MIKIIILSAPLLALTLITLDTSRALEQCLKRHSVEVCQYNIR